MVLSKFLCQNDFESRLSKIEKDLETRVTQLEELVKIGTLRSCAEYSQYGLNSDNFYMIDPDGPLLGEPPFQVFCNFTSGSTEILHDTENATEVEHCHDPGCFEKEIIYLDAQSESEVALSQIVSLIELSAYCEQSFQYDCVLAPLQSSEIDYSFWMDKHGINNAYFTGSNYGDHVCDCHYETEGCFDEELKHNRCNCDANQPVPLTDTGVITNSTALPVQKLFFGGLNFEMQSASFVLGRLKCFGQQQVAVGTSCSSLKKSGIFRSGYYNIKAEKETMLKSVFCDMESGNYEDVEDSQETLFNDSPLGTILPWVPKPTKSFGSGLTLPDGWVRCNGSTIPEPSIWAGQKTPDLNNAQRFLRGGTDASALSLEDHMLLDHEHSHTDPGHTHDYYDGYRNHDSSHGGDYGSRHEAYTYYTHTTRESEKDYTHIDIKGISGINSAYHGHETRPINMHVVYIIKVL